MRRAAGAAGRRRPIATFDWQRQATSFDALIAVQDRSLTLSGGADPERVGAAVARACCMLGIVPALGRDRRDRRPAGRTGRRPDRSALASPLPGRSGHRRPAIRHQQRGRTRSSACCRPT
jgi:hypothetical protein